MIEKSILIREKTMGIASTSYKPGESGNKNGRPKFSKMAKNEIRKITAKYLKEIDKDLETMSPKERWAVITSIMKYVLSTEVKSSTKVSGDMTIDVNWENNSEPENS